MIGVKSRAFNGGRGAGGAGSALRAAPSGTPAAPRPPSARHRPTIRCLRQSLWLKPALPANPLTTNYHFCRIPSLTTRGTLSVSHFRGRVHAARDHEPCERRVALRQHSAVSPRHGLRRCLASRATTAAPAGAPSAGHEHGPKARHEMTRKIPFCGGNSLMRLIL